MKRMRSGVCAFWLAALALALAAPAASAEKAGLPTGGFAPDQVLTLGNEYVVVGVTKTAEDAGRFALETTGGEPGRPGDDNKPLIYGRPRPWTSYTTVRLDGRDFVFGGETKTRAGLEGRYGEVTESPTLRDGAIETICRIGDLEVKQVLELAKSSTSGLLDTARIVYEVTNRGAAARQVGLRIMLDTMLGENDGAPIRMGERTLVGDASFAGKDLPSFWQAFDSLAEPKVMAQGTVADETTVRPDRIVVTNWGNLADNLWTVEVTPGRDFTREGEDELDSAIALYWNEQPLAPGETRLYATAYGLGGVTIIPGELTLGLTSPATVTEDLRGRASIPVVAYIQNVGKWPAQGVTATLQLPPGLVLAGGEQAVRRVGELAPGADASLMWQVQAENLGGQSRRFKVEVVARGLAPVAGERSVSVQGPPQLKLEGRPLPAVQQVGDALQPERVTVEVNVVNGGSVPAQMVRGTLDASTGFRLADFEKREKFLGNLAPGESRPIRWVILPQPGAAGERGVSIGAASSNARPATLDLRGELPPLASRVYFAAPPAPVRAGDPFYVDVRVGNVEALDALELNIGFDPSRVAVVGASRGSIFVGEGAQLRTFTVDRIDNQAGVVGLVRGKVGSAGATTGTILRLHLLALRPGTASLELRDVVVYSRKQSQSIAVEPLTLEITSK
ncbi:MAG: hypothetical protein ACM3RP_05830 [Chitinophagales bacterium]